MGIERTRVVEVYSPSQERVGSGYLVADRLVLTAGHVAGPEIGSAVEVRPLGTADWLPAVVVWRGEVPDAALARITVEKNDPRLPAEVSPIRWGEVQGREPVACSAVGFPWAQVRPDGIRDTEQLYGFIAPESLEKAERYAITVRTSPPASRPGEGSPWAGMSGAALFSELRLIGVVVVDPGPKWTVGTRIEASPARALLADEDFVRILGEAPPLAPVGSLFRLEVQPGLAVSLRPPYRALPRAFDRPEDLARAPAQLLLSDHGIVPFLGRETELAELEDWCDEESMLKLRVLTGRGGTGKTRLAAEACVRLTARDWVTGLIARAMATATGDALEDRTLLVVDDAELHVQLIADLLDRLAELGAKARLLLLSRRAGAWYEQLRQNLRMDLGLFLSPEMALDAQGLSPDQRTRHFAVAAQAFALHLGTESPSQSDLSLAHPAFEVPLLVHMNALLAAVGTLSDDGGPVDPRGRTLDRLLELEKGRWDPLAKAGMLPDLAPTVADRAVAVATLVGAATEEEAAKQLRTVPDLDNASDERLRNVTRWLHELYPGDGDDRETPYVVGVRPDLLAARHLARTLPQAPDLVVALCDSSGRHIRLLSVLCAAATDEPDLRDCLRTLLEQRLANLLDEAKEGSDASLAGALAASVRLEPNPGLAAQVIEQLPDRSIVLATLAAELQDQVVRYYRALEEATPQVFLPQLAAALDGLGYRLGDVGRREQAVEASREAVNAFKILARLDADQYLPDLAGAYLNFSVSLSALGRRKEAVVPMVGALRSFTILARTDPACEAKVALSLNNLSVYLRAVGKRERALGPIQDAVHRFENLVQADPEKFLPDLANSLGNLSACLRDLGRSEESLSRIDDALRLYRGLMVTRADAVRPGLARSLHTRSECLADLSRNDEAMADINEAVELLGDLAEAQPDLYMSLLARSLRQLAAVLCALGRPEQALGPIVEAVDHYRTLVDLVPQAFLPGLANSLHTFCQCQADVGRNAEALESIDEAIILWRVLADDLPRAFRPGLIKSLQMCSTCLVRLDREEEAQRVLAEAVALEQAGARAAPS